MPKANQKGGGGKKGGKRPPANRGCNGVRSNENANLNESEVENENTEGEVVVELPNPERKRKGNPKNTSAKRGRPDLPLPRNSGRNPRSVDRAVAEFEEDENAVVLEVNAAESDFEEEGEIFTEDPNDEDDSEIELSQNNNATRRRERSESAPRAQRSSVGRDTSTEPMQADEEEIVDVDRSLEVFQEMLSKGECYVDEYGNIRKGKKPRSSEYIQPVPKNHKTNDMVDEEVLSELTIYKNAVKQVGEKRISSSSEEVMDTSDETINSPTEMEINKLKMKRVELDDNIDRLLAEVKELDRRRRNTNDRADPQPGTSGYQRGRDRIVILG